MQHYWQHFVELGSDPASSNIILNNVVLPLSPDILTHNPSGVSMIVVCTKADLMDNSNDNISGSTAVSGMVKSKGDNWEEKTDKIMQILRTICLKCGFLRPLHISFNFYCSQMVLHYSIRLYYLKRRFFCVAIYSMFFSAGLFHHLALIAILIH